MQQGKPKKDNKSGGEFIGTKRIFIRRVLSLRWCANAGTGQGDRTNISIIGPDPEQYAKKYKLHDQIERQVEWEKTGG